MCSRWPYRFVPLTKSRGSCGPRDSSPTHFFIFEAVSEHSETSFFRSNLCSYITWDRTQAGTRSLGVAFFLLMVLWWGQTYCAPNSLELESRLCLLWLTWTRGLEWHNARLLGFRNWILFVTFSTKFHSYSSYDGGCSVSTFDAPCHSTLFLVGHIFRPLSFWFSQISSELLFHPWRTSVTQLQRAWDGLWPRIAEPTLHSFPMQVLSMPLQTNLDSFGIFGTNEYV